MDIKIKGDRSVSEFINTIHWLKPASHANLIYSLTKSTNVGNDVDIAGFLVCCAVINLFDGAINIIGFSFQFGFLFFERRKVGWIRRSDLLNDLLQGIGIMLLLLLKLFTLCLNFLFELCTFPLFCTEFLQSILFFLLFNLVLIGEMKFLQLQVSIRAGYGNTTNRA